MMPMNLDPEVLRYFIKSKASLLGLVIAASFVIIALLGPALSPYNPLEIGMIDRLQPPSQAHLLGTDDLGRDVLSRLLWGTRISIQLGVVAVSIGATIGITLGLLAGYFRGVFEFTVMRFTDILFAFPYFVLAIAIAAVLGPSLQNATIAIGVVCIPVYARLTWSQILSIRERPYIEAMRALGAGDVRVILLHLLPNCMAPLIVEASLDIGWAIVEGASLSFLGLGAQPPTPEWGLMVSAGRNYLTLAPWIAVFPGIAIAMVVLSFNLIGDGLRDALDPRIRTARG
jgi:peptide/nickel transport system permease protein